MTTLNASNKEFLIDPISELILTREEWEDEYAQDTDAISEGVTVEDWMSKLVEVEIDPEQELFVVNEGYKSIERMNVFDYCYKVCVSLTASENDIIEKGDELGLCAYNNLRDATEYLFQIILAEEDEEGFSAEQYANIYNKLVDIDADMTVVVNLLDDAFNSKITGHDGNDSIDFYDGSWVFFSNLECFAYAGINSCNCK